MTVIAVTVISFTPVIVHAFEFSERGFIKWTFVIFDKNLKNEDDFLTKSYHSVQYWNFQEITFNYSQKISLGTEKTLPIFKQNL
jgi:hypothetical protein